MPLFADDNELLRFAESFLDERLESLHRDVDLCLGGTYAPFPALLYCFSTVDLLGGLASGDASRSAPTSRLAKKYMARFMRYSDEQCRILMDLFRHKIVHLAQPKAVVQDAGRRISWRIWHDAREHHLKLLPIDPPVAMYLTSTQSISVDWRFELSIQHFARDISNSVRRPGGYLHALSDDPDLRGNCSTAMDHIYNP